MTASPTDGQANLAVCELVAKKFGIAKSAVSIVRGESSRDKTLLVEGIEEDEALRRFRET